MDARTSFLNLILLSLVFVSRTRADISCPTVCSCVDGVVDCSGLQLTESPGPFPSNSTTVLLSNNSISSIEENDFAGLVKLEILQLDRNDIGSIHANAFTSLAALTTLNLQHNKLHYLYGSIFLNNTHLNHLDIKNNALTNLPSSLFAMVKNFTALMVELSENPWMCDCHLEGYKEWLAGLNTPNRESFDIICEWPSELAGSSLLHVAAENMVCSRPPVFSDLFHLANVNEGGDVQLRCDTGDGTFNRISWILPNKTVLTLSNDREDITLGFGGKVLNIYSVTGAYDGMYACVVHNRTGRGQETTLFGVSVNASSSDSNRPKVIIREVCRSHETSSYVGVFLGGFILAVALGACAFPVYTYCRSRYRKALHFTDSHNAPVKVYENSGVQLQDFNSGEQKI